MACIHLRKLYQLCKDEEIRLSSSDLIHLVCPTCGIRDVCPSVLMEQFEEDDESTQDIDSMSFDHQKVGASCFED